MAHQFIFCRQRGGAAGRHVRHIGFPTGRYARRPACRLTIGSAVPATVERHLPAYPERVVEAAAADEGDGVYREGDGPPRCLQLLRAVIALEVATYSLWKHRCSRNIYRCSALRCALHWKRMCIAPHIGGNTCGVFAAL